MAIERMTCDGEDAQPLGRPGVGRRFELASCGLVGDPLEQDLRSALDERRAAVATLVDSRHAPARGIEGHFADERVAGECRVQDACLERGEEDGTVDGIAGDPQSVLVRDQLG